MSADDWVRSDLPWRVGRHVGRTVYMQVDPERAGDDDVLIGVMDTPTLARIVVLAVNEFLREMHEERPT